MTLFSIVIPVYNVESYLKECLDSVLGQTCGDFEAVCVNDGSTDGSLSILEDYAARDSRIRIISQPNGGLSAARNTGIDAAQGDYILFLDSDDWLESNTLQTLVDGLDSEDMLCFGGWRGDEVEQPTPAIFPTGWEYYNRCALDRHPFPFVCVVLRCYSHTFLDNNKLRFREGILHEDNHFTPRACLAAGQVRVISTPFYHYRIRQGSIMTTPQAERGARKLASPRHSGEGVATTRSLRSRLDMLRIANDLAGIFTQRDDIDRSIVYRAITHHYQAAFLGADSDACRQLLPLVDWHLYRTVSRTKIRHRLNYTLLRISPLLFRMVCHA